MQIYVLDLLSLSNADTRESDKRLVEAIVSPFRMCIKLKIDIITIIYNIFSFSYFYFFFEIDSNLKKIFKTKFLKWFYVLLLFFYYFFLLCDSLFKIFLLFLINKIWTMYLYSNNMTLLLNMCESPRLKGFDCTFKLKSKKKFKKNKKKRSNKNSTDI